MRYSYYRMPGGNEHQPDWVRDFEREISKLEAVLAKVEGAFGHALDVLASQAIEEAIEHGYRAAVEHGEQDKPDPNGLKKMHKAGPYFLSMEED